MAARAQKISRTDVDLMPYPHIRVDFTKGLLPTELGSRCLRYLDRGRDFYSFERTSRACQKLARESLSSTEHFRYKDLAFYQHKMPNACIFLSLPALTQLDFSDGYISRVSIDYQRSLEVFLPNNRERERDLMRIVKERFLNLLPANLAEICPQIQTLNFSDLKNTSSHDIASLFDRFPQSVTRIYMNHLYSKDVNDEFLIAVTNRFGESLHRLKLNCSTSRHKNAGITDAGLKALSRCRALRVLGLEGCNKITDKGIRSIATPLLEILNIRDCTMLSDESLSILAAKCPNLRELAASELKRITDEGILSLVTQCTELEKLSLKKCKKLTDASLGHIKKHCPNIRKVHLNKNKNITLQGVRNLIVGSKLDLISLVGCTQFSIEELNQLKSEFPAKIIKC